MGHELGKGYIVKGDSPCLGCGLPTLKRKSAKWCSTCRVNIDSKRASKYKYKSKYIKKKDRKLSTDEKAIIIHN